jgi:hypothetical protein
MVKVVAVTPLENYKLRVTLFKGRKGIFDVAPYLESNWFSEQKNLKYFKCVYVDYGIVVWPHEQDIAPETVEYDLQPQLAEVA